MVENPGVTYSEVRWWFVWLQAFTAKDLADTMAISEEVAERFIRAGLFHGIIYDTGESINGIGPAERIYAYVPLPSTIYPRLEGYKEIFNIRGLPVRIRTGKDFRRSMSSSQATRKQLKDQERRYQAMIRKQEESRRAKEARRQKRLQSGKKKWEA
jgi:hypothetical protein